MNIACILNITLFADTYSYIHPFTTAYEKPVRIFRIIFIFVPQSIKLSLLKLSLFLKLLIFLFLFQMHFNPYNDLANNVTLHMQKNNV